MSNKIAIVGAGAGVTALTKELIEKKGKDVVVLTPEDVKSSEENPFAVYDRYIYEALPLFVNEKPFICKGKHEYRNVDGQWICQCGRKTTD